MALIGSRTLQRETKRILDQVEDQGEPVVILRHGRPAAALVPIDQEQAEAIVLATSPELKARRAERRQGGASRQRPFAVSEADLEPPPDEESSGLPEEGPLEEEQTEILGAPAATFSEQFGLDITPTGIDSPPDVEDALILIATHHDSLRALDEFAARLARQTAALEALVTRRAGQGGEEAVEAAEMAGAEEAENAT